MPSAYSPPRRLHTATVAVLAMLGMWSMAVPYVGPLLGLILDVPPKLEVVDHVLPGFIVVTSSVLSLLLPRMGSALRHELLSPAMSSLAFLAGLWMTSTHVPLLFEAYERVVPWSTALFHSTPGIVVALVSLWLLVGELRALED